VLATGNPGLDEALAKALVANGVEVAGDPVYYREGLLKNALVPGAEAVVLSSGLGGAAPLPGIIFSLRRQNARVVLLCGNSEENLSLIKQAVRMGVYDIVTDPVRLRDVVERINSPASFADAAGRFDLGDAGETGEEDFLDQVFTLDGGKSPARTGGQASPKKAEVVIREKVVVREKQVIHEVSGVLTVFSGGGGNGKSTVSIHLALAAAARGFRPALVEVDEEKPCHLLAFGETVVKGLESLKEADFADASRLQRQLQEIAVKTKSGVALFAVAVPHSEIPVGSPEDMAALLSVLARIYRPVVVDATCRLKDASTLGAVLNADQVLLVVEPLRPTAESAAVLYRDMIDLGVEPGKVSLVINKVDKGGKLKRSFIEDIVGQKAAVLIPSDSPRYNAVFNSAKVSLAGGAPWQELLETFMWETVPNAPEPPPAKNVRWPFSMFARGKGA
jgi:MinD-like ATPase involved in chromosome partitioning or flagellar assembly